MPRNFIQEADQWLGFPKPLAELLQEDMKSLIFNLIKALENGGNYQRKYAAFVLGQIGDENFIQLLEKALINENIEGVLLAMLSSLKALQIASLQKGGKNLERCKLIDQYYSNNSPFR